MAAAYVLFRNKEALRSIKPSLTNDPAETSSRRVVSLNAPKRLFLAVKEFLSDMWQKIRIFARENFLSMRRSSLIITAVVLVVAAGGMLSCERRPSSDPYIGGSVQDTIVDEAAFQNDAPDTYAPIYLDESNLLVVGEPEEEKVKEEKPTPQRTVAPAAKSNESKPATGRNGKIYVHTWGAQGEVWGTVTMNGNTGHGTIHDAGENTYNIRVVRRGNELIATDQNGRQYVFKQ